TFSYVLLRVKQTTTNRIDSTYSGVRCYRKGGRAIRCIDGRKGGHRVAGRDKARYNGKGVLKAVQNVNEVIAEELIDIGCREQLMIDTMMIELRCCKARASSGRRHSRRFHGRSQSGCRSTTECLSRGISEGHARELPVPMMNILNGVGLMLTATSMSRVHGVPIGAPTFREAIRMGSEIFHSLKSVLKSKG
ncbi:MAG: hypothetical protein MZV49_13530, partial [Rhodopseudomonas palustris]|nr:hypothetical protein [Rhodopseudomonas palustris]